MKADDGIRPASYIVTAVAFVQVIAFLVSGGPERDAPSDTRSDRPLALDMSTVFEPGPDALSMDGLIGADAVMTRDGPASR